MDVLIEVTVKLMTGNSDLVIIKKASKTNKFLYTVVFRAINFLPL